MIIGIGYGNFADADKISVIVNADAAPAKRLVRQAKKDGMLIDATAGHKTRAVIVLSNNQVVISANLPETLAEKMEINK